MRLDKFLKVSRIIKRRTVSKDIINFGQVSLNDRKAKPASNVEIGDKISLVLGEKLIKIEVLSLNEKVRKEEAYSLYKIVEENDINPSL